jgi:metacaspase-1
MQRTSSLSMRILKNSAKPRPTILAKPATVVPKPIAGLKRVLLVGINYINTNYELAGCINDVVNMESQLRSFFPKCSAYKMLTDNTPVKPTKQNIFAAIDWLVSNLRPGENVFFQYSGHGGQVRDKNGDEVSGFDSCIYPINNGKIEVITDDEIRTRLASKIPAGCKCFIVIDACHSGTAVDLRYKWETPSFGKIIMSEDKKYSKTFGTVIFLSGCRDSQTAADTADENWRPCGALSWALVETWKSYGSSIKLKYLLWDIREFLKTKGYSQIPELTSGSYIDMNGLFDLSK